MTPITTSGRNSLCLQKLPTYPTYQTVEQLIVHEKKGNCVPVYVELSADLITPCMAYLRLAENSKYSFLLESVVGGENVSRYSFIGAGEMASFDGWVLC